MIEIKTQPIRDCTVKVPGSKSYTHRILIASALSEGRCCIENILRSEDTLLTLNALTNMGIRIDDHDETVVVYGQKGVLGPCPAPIYLANSGTSMRLLTSVAALGKGKYTLTGTKRMAERPIQDLLDGLQQVGVRSASIHQTGAPPIEIYGNQIKGGTMRLKCTLSSQFLSSVLLIAPYTKDGVRIEVEGKLVSKPYVDMTIDIMERLGVLIERNGYEWFQIAGRQMYRAGDYHVEPDCSQASYFWAAAAITQKEVKVKHLSAKTRQGDIRFARVLESMGCRVTYENDGIAVAGRPLSAIDVDMADMPDIVPTLSVVAAFANGETIIRNVAHLKEKECDRLGSVVTELKKLGVDANETPAGMSVKGNGKPPTLKAAQTHIHTYNDHRMAMSFAVAGLVLPGLTIENEQCVEKSFPNFWETFEGMY